MVKPYRIASWLGAGIFAFCVAVSSYVISNELKAPAAAYAIGFAPKGTASANFAMISYGLRAAEDPAASVSKREMELAHAGYRAEPLSTTALSLIIRSTPDGKVRQSLLARAGELTRRNSLLNEEQIRAAALRGDDMGFFRWLSRSVLTNNDLRAAYVGAMADATAKEGAVAALTPVIGPAPSWAQTYWQLVIARPASLINAAKLRVAVARAPWRRTTITQEDRLLSIRLTNQGQIGAARALYEGLGFAPGRRSDNILENGDFARQPELPPFDWQLATSGTLGASIDEEGKSLLVSAIGGARGFAARQLVALQPGNYRLSWSVSASMPIDSSLLARVHCAEQGVKVPVARGTPLTLGHRAATIAIPESACRWYWLSIDAVLSDDSPGVDAHFSNISLAPVGGEGKAGMLLAPSVDPQTN